MSADLLLLELALFAASRGVDLNDIVRDFKKSRPELFEELNARRSETHEYHFIHLTDQETP